LSDWNTSLHDKSSKTGSLAIPTIDLITLRFVLQIFAVRFQTLRARIRYAGALSQRKFTAKGNEREDAPRANR
jgi:hypothetical protein